MHAWGPPLSLGAVQVSATVPGGWVGTYRLEQDHAAGEVGRVDTVALG
jgi:hypothetical protein